MSTTTNNFPRWTHLLVLFVILILTMFAGSVALMSPGLAEDETSHMSYLPLLQIIVFIPMVWYAYRQAGRPALFANVTGTRPGPVTIVLAIVGCLCVSIAAGTFLQLLPGYERFAALMDQVGDPALGAALAVVILAPILEEILCRGLILRKYLEKTTATRAILISGLFFGLLHLHPLHVLSASLMGFAIGYAYYRTGSIRLAIVIHLANNLLAYLGTRYDIEDPALLTDYGALGTLVSTLIFGAAGVLLLRLLGSRLPAYDHRRSPDGTTPSITKPVPTDVTA